MKKIFLYALILSTGLMSCKKEKALDVDLNKSNLDSYKDNDTDKWLKANFLDVYNMEVMYRFDRFQIDLDKDAVPVIEAKVRPMMEAFRSVYITPYLNIAGKNFFMPIVPKEVALFGSAQYRTEDHTRLLGTADAGRQINLFEVNKFDPDDFDDFLEKFHTIHHEFTHILNQNIPVPPGYEEVSNNYVGAQWIQRTEEEAQSLGFITPYSRMNKNEDFAEMTSTLLVEGQDYFDVYTNSASADGAAKLRAKERIIVDYFKASFGMDFRALQAEVKKAIAGLTTGSLLSAADLFAGGIYKSVSINQSAANQSTAFVTAFNTAVTAASAPQYDSPLLPQFELVFADATRVNRTDLILKFTDGAYVYWFNLKATYSGSTIKLARSAPGTSAAYGNGTFIEVPIKPLLDYFTTKTFKIDWIENIIPGSKDKQLGFIDTSNNKLGFYGAVSRY
ncbi:substrate import-associated zinc metallohydrolase lipoprotein [Pedobacter nutrimenti]|uniref:substrate import-associated zinc metallohydrolase lipoprotein n=1 Tax=Pedobacter nutrimenti TaxID=1241337 RepID=UPI002930C6A3|nr:substrate import-associated zinc metallohydrolase lipoprotein [Pedobacter nutrimenti]